MPTSSSEAARDVAARLPDGWKARWFSRAKFFPPEGHVWRRVGDGAADFMAPEYPDALALLCPPNRAAVSWVLFAEHRTLLMFAPFTGEDIRIIDERLDPARAAELAYAIHRMTGESNGS